MLLPWPLPQSWDTPHAQHSVHAGYAGPRMDSVGHRQEDSFPPGPAGRVLPAALFNCSQARLCLRSDALLKKTRLYS